MPLTGTFLADFTSFFTAAQQAEQGLENIEKQSFATASQIERMAEKFTGQKMISDAAAMVEAVERMGGAAKLTDAELQRVAKSAEQATAKLRAMGQDVPENMQKYAGMVKQTDSSMKGMLSTATSLAGAFGITFSVQSVVAFGQHVLATADNLTKLSDQTGMSVEEVQRLSYTAGQAGNTLEQLTQASSKLQDTLSTEAGQEAVEALGISFQELRAAKPYDQLIMISDAIKTIPDPTARAQAAIEIFGRSGAAILPTLISDMREVGNAANVASDETVAALDAAGDALDRFKTNVTTAAVGAAGSLILAGEEIANRGLLASIKAWVDSPTSAIFIQQLTAMRMAALEGEKTFAALQAQAANIGLPTTGAPETPKDRAKREREEAAAKREGEQAAQALADAQARLDIVRQGSAAILAGLGEETVAAIQHDLELGASQADLALDYGLTATAIAAVAKAYQDQKKAAEETAKGEAAATKIVEEATRQWHADRLDLISTTTDREKNAIEEWKATALESLQATGHATQEQYDEIEAIARERLARVGIDWDTVAEGSKAALQDTADRAKWTYGVMTADSDKYTAAAIANAKKVSDDAQLQLLVSQGKFNEEQQRMFADAEEGYAKMAGWMKDIPPLQDLIAAGFNKWDIQRWNEQEEAAARVGDEMKEVGDYMAAYGVSMETAREALGLATNDAEQLTDATQRGAAAAQQSSQQFGLLADAASRAASAVMSVAEKKAIATRIDDAYRAAGIFVADVGHASQTYWREAGLAEQRAGWMGLLPDELTGKGKVWGTGQGATQTTNTLNVNVNNADAGQIADKLVTEMRHQGVRF